MLGKSLLSLLRENKIPYVASDKSEANVCIPTSLQRFGYKKNITHVINCAAYTDVEKAEEYKELAYEVNAYGAENVAIWAKKASVKLIHFSSDYVFDGRNKEPYKEDSPCQALNYYGYTKYMAERKILDQDISACIIRTSWLFGYEGTHFLGKMLTQMQSRSVVDVICDQVGRLTFCPDLATITLSMLDKEGIYHFANAKELSWFELTTKLYKFCGEKKIDLSCVKISPVKSEEFRMRAKRPLYSVLDTNKIEKTLQVKIRNWSTCMEEYLDTIYGISRK